MSTIKIIYSLSLVGHLGNVSSLAISPDGSTVYTCGGDDNTVKIWNSKTGRIIRTLNNSTSFVSHILANSDQTVIYSANSDKTIKIWDAKTGEDLLTLIGHRNRILCIDVSSDGKTFASGDADGNIKVWNLDTGNEIFNLHQKPYSNHSLVINEVCQVAVSPDRKILVSTILTWDWQNNDLIAGLKDVHSQTVDTIALTPDNQILISAS